MTLGPDVMPLYISPLMECSVELLRRISPVSVSSYWPRRLLEILILVFLSSYHQAGNMTSAKINEMWLNDIAKYRVDHIRQSISGTKFRWPLKVMIL